jgi:hypothetical protein
MRKQETPRTIKPERREDNTGIPGQYTPVISTSLQNEV